MSPVRGGIRLLLESLDGVTVLAEASDNQQALRLVTEHHPDVVLRDIAMPGDERPGTHQPHHARLPRNQGDFLSMHVNEEYVAELEVALEALLPGDIYLSPRQAKLVVGSYLHRIAGEAAANGPTPRQLEILHIIAEGRSGKHIAFDLSVSVKTVDTHHAQLMDRLGIHDIAGLVRYAIRIRLITEDGSGSG
ncbi:MAG: response regulator transcription factor [Burkholderiales bacterium]